MSIRADPAIGTIGVDPRMISTILVVDDDPMAREFSGIHLGDERVSVETAADGEAGWEKLQSRNYDAVLLDIDMPGMSGLDLIGHIKRTPALADLPVIIVSGREDSASLERAYAEGAFVFCPKPVNWRLLKVQLDHALEMRRLKSFGYI